VEPLEVTLTALRVWLGTVMLAHGINHGRDLPGTEAWFAKKGFEHARLQAILSSAGEIAIGVGLLLGFLTSLAAAALVIPMVVAFGAIHRFAGFFVFARPDEGWEYVATLVVAATVVATAGGGPVSVDAWLGLQDTLTGWPGLGLVAGGVILGWFQLLVFWRKPDPR
jgi:putative oxidoreductase